MAYHESGHALIAELVPTQDRYLLTREELKDYLTVILGGRAAEQAMFGMISTGASSDVQ